MVKYPYLGIPVRGWIRYVTFQSKNEVHSSSAGAVILYSPNDEVRFNRDLRMLEEHPMSEVRDYQWSSKTRDLSRIPQIRNRQWITSRSLELQARMRLEQEIKNSSIDDSV